jgi:signal transduction histidine kinase/ligand-binding sensor domain-containing protein
MGTKDGLNRFDGYTFKVFRNIADDSTSIGDNFIRSLYIDTGDRLYAGTRNGVYRYDPITETFTCLYKTNAEVRDIKKDADSTIWFVAGETLISCNEKTRALRLFPQDKYFSATSICIDQDSHVWVSTATGQLEEYNPANDSFTAYNVFDPGQSGSKWIEKIYATGQSTILVGTSNYGVKLFNIRDSSYNDILTYNVDKTEIFARDFIQSSDTEFWMATESGIFIYNTATQSFTNLKKQYNNPYSVSDNAVYTLCKDREGGIWAGTYFGGANYYSKQYARFQKYLPDYSPVALSGNAVREICEDKYGNLWIGTEDAGLNKLDRQTGLFTQFKPTGASTSISYSNVHGLLAKDDELWIGTFEHGLNIMDIKTGKVTRHFPGGKNSKLLRSNFIVALYETKKGETFLGTRQGLYRFNEQETSAADIAAIPPTAFVHTMLEDRNGILWVGTLGSGLFYYDPASGRSGHVTYSARDKNGISSNSITTLFQDSQGILWLGTEGGGLCKFNAADSSFIHYSTDNGFPANTIFKILEDNRRKLWITTSRGLVRFDPATEQVNIYTTASGLLSDQFNYNSGYKDRNGRMYFGCVKGLISFHPDTFIDNNYAPPLFITSIAVNNKELRADAASPLKRSVLFTDRIDLPYNQSTFSIDFAALSFATPELTEYKYIMEGLDDQWTYLKTNRKVYFTNLSPGTYTFRVNAARKPGHWNAVETTLLIKIHPPFWASTWAYLLYAVLAIVAVFYLFRNYHRRVAEKNARKIELMQHEKEKEIYQAKIDFFTNVAHEIRTPLTLIKAPMEKIVKKAGDNAEIGQNLKIMERNTDRLIELTNQLLDFSKVETNAFHLNFSRTNISELLTERYISFKTLAEQKGIRLSLRLPDKRVVAYVDPDSLHKILNNLFYNALNYGKTEAQVALVTDKENSGRFTIEFSNDGHIVPPAMREKIFEPFYRLKQTASKPGTGIGLSLSRSLAILHKGELYLKEPDNERNVFVVSLPLEQDGLQKTQPL